MDNSNSFRVYSHVTHYTSYGRKSENGKITQQASHVTIQWNAFNVFASLFHDSNTHIFHYMYVLMLDRIRSRLVGIGYLPLGDAHLNTVKSRYDIRDRVRRTVSNSLLGTYIVLLMSRFLSLNQSFIPSAINVGIKYLRNFSSLCTYNGVRLS